MSTTDTPTLRDLAGRIDHLRGVTLRAFDEAGRDFDIDRVKSIPGTRQEKLEKIRQADRELSDLHQLVEARLDLVGTRLPAGEGKARQRRKSVGEQFVASHAFTNDGGAGTADGPSATLDIDPGQLGIGVKAVLGTSTEAEGVDTAYPLLDPRTSVIARVPEQPPNLAEAVPTYPFDAWQARWLEETTANNGAAPVQEAATFPEPELELAEIIKRLQKIGVMLPVTDELIEDDIGARNYLDQRLGLFCRERVDAQLLTGDGTGENLLGFHKTAGINKATYVAAGATVQDKITAILQGAGKVAKEGKAIADSVVIEAAEWWDFLAAQDTTGEFLFDPATPPTSFFGLRPIVSTNETEGRYLVGALQQHSLLFARRDVQMRISREHDDFFTKGKVMLRASLPAWLAVLRPKAFTEVTGA